MEKSFDVADRHQGWAIWTFSWVWWHGISIDSHPITTARTEVLGRTLVVFGHDNFRCIRQGERRCGFFAGIFFVFFSSIFFDFKFFFPCDFSISSGNFLNLIFGGCAFFLKNLRFFAVFFVSFMLFCW